MAERVGHRHPRARIEAQQLRGGAAARERHAARTKVRRERNKQWRGRGECVVCGDESANHIRSRCDGGDKRKQTLAKITGVARSSHRICMEHLRVGVEQTNNNDENKNKTTQGVLLY